MVKSEYEVLDIEVLAFENEDVIVTSCVGVCDDELPMISEP